MQSAFFAEEIPLKKCSQHPQEICDTIYLKPTGFSPFTCPHCRSSRNISNKDLILINDLYESSQEILYPNYPILTNPQTIYDLEQVVEESKRVEKEFELFFTELKANLIESIDRTKQQQIQKLSALTDAYKQTLIAYYEAVSMDRFKQAIQSDNLDDKLEAVSEFLKEQYTKAEQNTSKIQQNIDSFSIIIQRFTLSQAKETHIAINHLLQNLTIFPEKAISKHQHYHEDHQLLLSPLKQQFPGESQQFSRNQQVLLVQQLQQLLQKSAEINVEQLDAEFNNLLEIYLKLNGREQNKLNAMES